jgi:hypothetical protein
MVFENYKVIKSKKIRWTEHEEDDRSIQNICEISGSYSGEYEDGCLLFG